MNSRWEDTPEEVRRRLVRDQWEKLGRGKERFWLELPYREAEFARRLEANHGVWRVEPWEIRSVGYVMTRWEWGPGNDQEKGNSEIVAKGNLRGKQIRS